MSENTKKYLDKFLDYLINTILIGGGIIMFFGALQ